MSFIFGLLAFLFLFLSAIYTHDNEMREASVLFLFFCMYVILCGITRHYENKGKS